MRIRFLGTNGWYDTGTGNTVCVLVESDSEYLIFDAGNGFHKIDEYVKENKRIRLFLSHYHLDHIIGLHALNKFHFARPVDIYGPPGLKASLKRFLNRPYTVPIGSLPVKLRLHEIGGRGGNCPDNVFCRPLKHSGYCYGYRVLLEGKTITYCTDTGVCANLYSLAADADVFISECSYKSGMRAKADWPHLDPRQAASAALKADVKKLYLTHFDASIYLTRQDRRSAQKEARKVFRNTWSARDGMAVSL